MSEETKEVLKTESAKEQKPASAAKTSTTEKKAEPKKEETKKEQPKKEEAKKAEPKKEEAKKTEPKNVDAEEDSKHAEAEIENSAQQSEPEEKQSAKTEPEKEQPKKEEPKKEQPKKEEPKKTLEPVPGDTVYINNKILYKSGALELGALSFTGYAQIISVMDNVAEVGIMKGGFGLISRYIAVSDLYE